jgi:hypothetical protein
MRNMSIALEDYQLVNVYFEALVECVQLVEKNNHTLTDLRVSPVLPSAVTGVFVDWETIAIMEDQSGHGMEVFSNDNADDRYDIGFHVRRRFCTDSSSSRDEYAANMACSIP